MRAQDSSDKVRPMRLSTLALVALAGCGHTGYREVLTPPDRGGPAWTEVTSEHFRVLTDQSPDVAARTSRALEETHAAFEKLWGIGMVGRSVPLGRVEFVAFDRMEDFQAVSSLPRSKAIFTMRQFGIDPQPTIVSWGPLGEDTRKVLQHELAHRFVRLTLPFAPLWLNEGLAEYFSTFEIADGIARFGKRPYVVGQGAMDWAQRLPSLERILSADWRTFHEQAEEARFYQASWALVHYFEHNPALRPRFRDYQMRMAQGEEPRPAFDAAFEGVDRAQIDREFREQAAMPGVAVLEGHYAATPAPSSRPRHLGDAEVRVMFAQLRPWMRSSQARIGAELDEATQLFPRNPEVAHLRAWYELRSGHLAPAETAARRAVELQPEDLRYQFTLAQVMYTRLRTTPAPHDWKPLRAMLKPLWPAATTAPSLNFIAWIYAEMGEPDLAQPFARKAVETDPGCFSCLDTLARILQETGFVEEALPLEERAVALLPERVRIPDFFKRLEQLRAAVAAAKN
jgi:tetratricopeptide (TPR) repeat protein